MHVEWLATHRRVVSHTFVRTRCGVCHPSGVRAVLRATHRVCVRVELFATRPHLVGARGAVSHTSCVHVEVVVTHRGARWAVNHTLRVHVEL